MNLTYVEAKAFCDLLYPSRNLSFISFPKQDPSVQPDVRFGTLDDNWEFLQEINGRGYDVFVPVNQCDGRWIKSRNITSITSILVDLDGSSPEPMRNSPLPPHIELESSRGRFQGRWKIKPIPITNYNRASMVRLFRRVQLWVARIFDADPNVFRLPVIARAPGFNNNKYEEPFPIRIVRVNDYGPIALNEFITALGIDLSKPAFPGISIRDVDVSFDGPPIMELTRHVTLFSIARKLRYEGRRRDELFHTVWKINLNRCKDIHGKEGPLDDREVRLLVNDVNEYFDDRQITIEACIEKILQRNPCLSLHNGVFYRYSRKDHEYRVLEKRALTNLIFNLNQGAIGRSLIDAILYELSVQVPQLKELPGNTESSFLSECIATGGRATLREIYGLYRSWCERNEKIAVSQACLRKEIEARFRIECRKSIRVGPHFHRGFVGICIKESRQEHELS